MSEGEEGLDPYAERILAAARRLLLEHGLHRTSLASVAAAADVSEATLYRRFASRDELLQTVMAREQRAFIAQLDAEVRDVEDPVDRLVISFITFTRTLHRHELVHRLMATDPDRVLPLLTTGGAPWLAMAQGYVADRIRRAADAGLELTADPDHIAELFVRIAHSLVLTPESVLPLDDEEQLTTLARATLAPMVVASGVRR